MGGKGRRVFRNNYKGHIQKSKMGWNHRREMGMTGVGLVVGEKYSNCT